jgi:hypothetical protein
MVLRQKKGASERNRPPGRPCRYAPNPSGAANAAPARVRRGYQEWLEPSLQGPPALLPDEQALAELPELHIADAIVTDSLTFGL